MRLVAGPVRNVAGNMIYLYAFPGDNSAAWVAPVAVKAPDESVLATVTDPRFDVTRVALFDTAAAVPAQPVPQQLPAALDLKTHVTRYEPGHITLDLDRPAPAGAALLVSENYYPGWHATVDGKAAAIGRADYTLIGVALPAGARHVDLTFASPVYQRGKAITLAALVLGVSMTLVGLVFGARRRV
jgi:hypothetical protein